MKAAYASRQNGSVAVAFRLATVVPVFRSMATASVSGTRALHSAAKGVQVIDPTPESRDARPTGIGCHQPPSARRDEHAMSNRGDGGGDAGEREIYATNRNSPWDQ